MKNPQLREIANLRNLTLFFALFILSLAVTTVHGANGGDWLWDQNSNGIDDRIETLESVGIESAFENNDPVLGRMTFAVHEVGGVFHYPVYVQYAHRPGADDIQRLVDSGVSTSVLHLYQIIDYIRMELTFDEIQTVLGLPGVTRVESIPMMYPMNNNAIETSGVRQSNFQRFPTVWEHLGISGKDIVVSVLDTGVNDAPDNLTGYPGHESLIGRFVAGGNFFSGQPLLNTGPDDSENPIDRGEALASNHGTHVAGTAIGTGGPSGFFSGVAPDALLVDQKVLSDAGAGFGSADGVEWAVLNMDQYNIRILNLSLGGLDNSDGTDAGSQAINAAFDAGILAAIAAGNDGETGWMPSPAAADKAVTVGAIHDQNTLTREDDVIASFSNEGPRLDDGTGRVEPRMKPVVAAPGAGVVSADGSLLTDGRQYQSLSGTSMASPVVAGVMALILEANPDLTPIQVVEILKHTSEHHQDWGKTPAGANPFPDADPNYHPSGGWGQVDAYAGVKEALRLAGDPASQVQVVYITAAPDADGAAAIDVEWKSQREIELSGYNVLRAPDVGGAPGSFVQINSALIPGIGEATIEERDNRNEYSFRDADGLAFGQTYWYVIEHDSAAGTFQEPAFPVTLGEPSPVARIEYSITHNAIDNDLLTLVGTGTQVARADWIRTGKSASEADSVTTEPGDPTAGTERHEFSINLTSRDMVEEFLPPSDSQRWFLSVTEGGFINRFGRVNDFAIHMLDEDGNITQSFETGDLTPQQTVENQTAVLWIPSSPDVVLPGETPVVVEADPEAAVQDSELQVGIFGAKFLPLAEVEVSGDGVDVVTSSVVAGSEIQATFAIDADATPGPRDITVTNIDGGSGTGENLFTVVLAGDPGDPGDPTVVDLDDADPVIEYFAGWHRRSSDSASHDGYHRRMGSNNSQGTNSTPTARLVFTGDQITYFYGQSENGGTADVFIDGALMTTVDYSGSANRNDPDFGQSITFEVDGEGEHEIVISHRTGAVNVDGFRITTNGSGEEAGANSAAVRTRSLTTEVLFESPGTLLGGLPLSLERTIDMSPDDLQVSIEIEDAGDDLMITLIDPLGRVLAEAVSLDLGGGQSMYSLDSAVATEGPHLLVVSSLSGVSGGFSASVARTVAVDAP